MSAASLSQDAEFEVDDGATKAKIKSAFIKSLKTKKLNKKVLGEFISLVAWWEIIKYVILDCNYYFLFMVDLSSKDTLMSGTWGA